MTEDKDEMDKFKFILFVGAVFLVSMFQSCKELKYTVFGESAQGRVTQTNAVEKIRGRGLSRREIDRVHVHFVFKGEDGSTYRGQVETSPREAEALRAEEFEVAYMADEPKYTALPSSHRSIIWPSLFGVTLVVLAISVIRLGMG